jgi:hypothetical protein
MGSRKPKAARHPGWFAGAGVIVWITASVLLAGCVLPQAASKSGAQGKNTAEPEQRVFGGVDTSGSMAVAERRRAFGMLSLLLDQGLRPDPRLTIFTYDERVRLLLDNPVASSDELQVVEDEICGGRPELESLPVVETTRTTYPARVLTAILKRISSAPHPTEDILVLCTDGEDEEPAQTRAVVAELAKRKEIKLVWIVGVAVGRDLETYRGTDLYAQVRETYAPFGSRLVVTSRLGLEAGLSEAKRVLEGE